MAFTIDDLAPGVRIYCGDALEVLPTLEAGSVDAVVTDPPYNVSRQDRITRGALFGQGGPINLDFGTWDYGSLQWQTFMPPLVHVLTSCGVLVMCYERIALSYIAVWLREQYGFCVRHIGALVKTNPAPQARKVKWQNGLEQFLVVTKNQGAGHHFDYKQGQSPDYFIRSVNYKHLHPTQKPLDFMQWIVRYWSFGNDSILDPFMGSGTTGVACVQLGRRFLGVEIEAKYYEIAKRRISEALLQGKLL